MTKLIILCASLLIASCTNQSDANKSLIPLGFTDIKVTGYKWFACHKDDFYHTGFVAKDAKGNQTYGTVCSGIIFKNGYVRFD